MAAPPRADFKLILDTINPAQAPAIIAELMEVLNIDRRTATAATQQAPLVLVGGMSQQQAAVARTHVVRLARLGAKLRLTAEPIGKLKALTWKSIPQFVRRPGNLFVCPSCGERFLVQRWLHQPAQAAAPAAAAPGPAVAEAEPVEAEPFEAEPVAEEPEEAAEPAVSEEPEPVVSTQEPEEVEEPLETEAEEFVAEAEPLMAEPIEAEPIEAEALPEPEPYEEPEPEPAVAPQAATSGPVYDVSVAKVRGPKQDRLAELIAERLRISFEEASRMCERTIIMVCKGAPESEAAAWRKALSDLGLKPRIRKRS